MNTTTRITVQRGDDIKGFEFDDATLNEILVKTLQDEGVDGIEGAIEFIADRSNLNKINNLMALAIGRKVMRIVSKQGCEELSTS